jgi:hypothetical protein
LQMSPESRFMILLRQAQVILRSFTNLRPHLLQFACLAATLAGLRLAEACTLSSRAMLQ